MALATTTDVAHALGRSLTTAETDRANLLLETASEAVTEAAGGYRFAPASYTVTRKPQACQVWLPAKVATVSAVREVDQATGAETTLTGWTLRGSKLYGVSACEVEVDFTVSAAIPASIAALVAGVVAATLGGPAVGTQSESTGPFSVSYVDASGRVWLTASDRKILGKYRRPQAAIKAI